MNAEVNNTVVWGQSTYDSQFVIATNGASYNTPDEIQLQASDLNKMGTYRKFAIYMSHEVIIMYIDTVEMYRFNNDGIVQFPTWAVLGGFARVGIYNAGKGSYRNFKVYGRRLPTAPMLITPFDVTETTVTLSWDINSNGDAVVTGYLIESSLDNVTWTSVYTMNDPLAVLYVVDNLTAGTTYYFRVTKNNNLANLTSIAESVEV